MFFTAYFFNARTSALEPVQIARAYADKQVCDLIGCSRFELVSLADHHAILCDDCGLSDGLISVAEIDGVETPLGGNLIITGVGHEGELVSPDLSLCEVAERIEVLKPILDPILRREKNEGVEIGFDIRLVRQRPAVRSGNAPR